MSYFSHTPAENRTDPDPLPPERHRVTIELNQGQMMRLMEDAEGKNLQAYILKKLGL